VTRESENRLEHRIATEKSARANNVAWVLMLCSFVASLTVVMMQFGVINILVDQLDGPAPPPPVIRIDGVERKLTCVIQPGSTPEAPYYKCTQDK